MDVFLEEKIDEIVEKIKEVYNIEQDFEYVERSKAGDLFLPGQRWSYCSGPPLNGEQERIFLTEFIKKVATRDDTIVDDYKEYMKGVLKMVDDDTKKKKLFFLKGNTQNPLLAKIHSELVKEAEKWSAKRLPVEIEIELPTTVVRRPVEILTTVVRPTRSREIAERGLKRYWKIFRRWLKNLYPFNYN